MHVVPAVGPIRIGAVGIVHALDTRMIGGQADRRGRIAIRVVATLPASTNVAAADFSRVAIVVRGAFDPLDRSHVHFRLSDTGNIGKIARKRLSDVAVPVQVSAVRRQP